MKLNLKIYLILIFPLIVNSQDKSTNEIGSTVEIPIQRNELMEDDSYEGNENSYDTMAGFSIGGNSASVSTDVNYESGQLISSLNNCKTLYRSSSPLVSAKSSNTFNCSNNDTGKTGQLCFSGAIECVVPVFGNIVFENVLFVTNDVNMDCESIDPNEAIKNAFNNPLPSLGL